MNLITEQNHNYEGNRVILQRGLVSWTRRDDGPLLYERLKQTFPYVPKLFSIPCELHFPIDAFVSRNTCGFKINLPNYFILDLDLNAELSATNISELLSNIDDNIVDKIRELFIIAAYFLHIPGKEFITSNLQAYSYRTYRGYDCCFAVPTKNLICDPVYK